MNKRKNKEEKMENLEVMLSMAGTIVGLLITALTFIVKFIKNAKARKLAEQVVEIGNAVLPYIQDAEKFIAFSGVEKKAYVMTKAHQFAIDNDVPFDKELIDSKIEELVTLTKKVNVKNSTSEKAETKTEEVSAQKMEQTVAPKSWL